MPVIAMNVHEAWIAALGLGQEASDLGPLQVAARVAIVYAVTLMIVRFGKKRFMGRGTAFDVIVGIIVGSVASRAITGNAPLGPALTGVATLLALHWLFSAIALRWHGFGSMVKGHSRVVIRDGVVDEPTLRAAHLTHRDLDEDLRAKSYVRVEEIAEARIERDGSLSVERKPVPPRIVEVEVAAGVQRVRIEIA
ncbi:DUF421 domain-containing protein [Sphingomonas xinjiangensis]|uniref:Uncharacterized membrane protein YcaP (DUF421 family) n=1 Tax=Sphingomonas xinjiangensis TaxID=643568 RepID=A0A840YPM7_9SPHN|nr:YetF domain-containing protein [Sphingomonas xinjiangensis]MBB5709523.1 uncharacterized membrane protein YcaP (DUF421 family) [Sphingomonas xinjiangensis]